MQCTDPKYQAELTAWAHSPVRLREEPLDALYAIVEKLNELGIEIGLASLIIRTPHPQLDMLVLRWRPREVTEVPTESTSSILGKRTIIRKGGVQDIFPLAHGHTDEAMWQESPFYRVLETEEVLRIRLEPPPTDSPYAIVHDLIDREMTDYAVFPIPSSEGTSIALSLASRRDDGFPEEFLSGFLAVLPPLSLSLAYKAERIQFREVLSAYLGHEPASRVLDGQLRRGDIDSQEAAIGFADLRGFSRDSETLEPSEVLRRLNVFFELVCSAVTNRGGEILKFLGDGVLFVFPVASSPERTCNRASAAIQQLSSSVSAINNTEESPIRFGCALHFGSVLYGNIGAPSRLDFTVIGKAVNLTARLESICSMTSRECLMSERFAQLTSVRTDLVGEFEFKGFSAPQRVYAPRGMSSTIEAEFSQKHDTGA